MPICDCQDFLFQTFHCFADQHYYFFYLYLGLVIV